MNRAPGTPLVVDAENPWPGLVSFGEEHADYFHGRQREVDDLFRRVRRSPLTVLCGQSGLGKTSLVQAALFPKLRAAGRGAPDVVFVPVGIRIDYSRGAPPVRAQIFASMAAALEAEQIEVPPLHDGETLWEYFHRVETGLCDRRGHPVTPVLAFDQFEELFTLGHERDADPGLATDTIEELASLVENRPTEFVEGRFNREPELVEKYDFDQQDYRVLLSLREDYLAHLHGLARKMPAVIQNNMRLTPLDGLRALEAVEKPGGRLVTPAAAEAIVRYVAGAREERRELGQAELPDPDTGDFRSAGAERIEALAVDPSLLSLFCRELNQKRKDEGLPAITPELVAAGREDILRNFYERCLAGLPAGARLFVEENLLTESGYRETLSEDTAVSQLRRHGVEDSRVLAELVNRRLLHFEERGGLKRVELTHDVLAPVVRQSRDERKQRERIAIEQQERERELEEERRRILAAREEAERHDAERTRELARARRQRKAILGASVLMAIVAAVALYQTVQARKLSSSLRAQADTLRFINDSLLGQRQALRDTTLAATLARDSAARLTVSATAARDTARRMATRALRAQAASDSMTLQFCTYTSGILSDFSDSSSRRSAAFGPALVALIKTSDSTIDDMARAAPGVACPQRLFAQMKALAAEHYREKEGDQTRAMEMAVKGLGGIGRLEQLRDTASMRIAAQAYLDYTYTLYFLRTAAGYDSAIAAARRGARAAARLNPNADTTAFDRRARLFHYGALALIARGRPQEARAMADSGLAVGNAGLRHPRQDRIGLFYTMSQLALRRGEADSAVGNMAGLIEGYRLALQSSRGYAYRSWNFRWHANMHGWLGDALVRTGRAREALVAYDSSLARWRDYVDSTMRHGRTEEAGFGTAQIVRRTLSTGVAEDSLGRADRAMALARSAAEIADREFPRYSSSVELNAQRHSAIQRLVNLTTRRGDTTGVDSLYRAMVANDSAFVIGRRGVRDAMNDYAIALENRAQFAYERHQLQHALADDRRRLLVRREILDSLQRSQPRNFAQLRVERENLASAWLGLGWHYLVAGIADTAVLANRQVPRFDGTNDYWIPNELNALLITGRIAEADSVFRRHARAQVERPRVPFPCAVLRDLEVTLIPRGAARAEHVTQAEELFRKHSPISPAECSHRKSPRTP